MSDSDELDRHIAEARIAYLGALVRECQRRFVDAAELVGVEHKQWPNLYPSLSAAIDCTHLIPFWHDLGHRYLVERLEEQLDMITGNLSVIERFSRYIYWHLWPELVKDKGVVRAVLKATGALPCADPTIAGKFMRSFIALYEMEPRRPIWTAEQMDKREGVYLGPERRANSE